MDEERLDVYNIFLYLLYILIGFIIIILLNLLIYKVLLTYTDLKQIPKSNNEPTNENKTKDPIIEDLAIV